MAFLNSNKRAILTARTGPARASAARCAFVPTFVTGATPGSHGGRYGWRRRVLPTTAWKAIKR